MESIVIDNKNGQVILPHKKHAEAYGCVVCHGDKKPGPHKLGKDAAHALCQGCHKEKKAGPTGCTQCHQKKAKALEGC
ncbi:MAG: cytochrome C [Deltaproteobacteria bacterium HGW-Deltaproteobacteria-16]|nr:MAG: cytochrome C [Deltaproteobacteria bacterium HGW-Deltaproteobacteria-16]